MGRDPAVHAPTGMVLQDGLLQHKAFHSTQGLAVGVVAFTRFCHDFSHG